jgi:hypothetical protein
MIQDFSSYEAYLERYRMFWSEEGDGRPPMLSPEEFREKFQLLRECYRTYREMIQDGREDKAADYYVNVINSLENELAIADGSDNFLFDDRKL